MASIHRVLWQISDLVPVGGYVGLKRIQPAGTAQRFNPYACKPARCVPLNKTEY